MVRRREGRGSLSENGVVGSVRPALVGWSGTWKVCPARPSGHHNGFLGGRYSLISVAPLPGRPNPWGWAFSAHVDYFRMRRHPGVAPTDCSARLLLRKFFLER